METIQKTVDIPLGNDKTIPLRSDNRFVIGVVLLSLILVGLIIGFGIIFFYEYNKDKIPFIGNDTVLDPSVAAGTLLDIIDPKENDILNGEIALNLRYKGDMDTLIVGVYDDEDNLLGIKEVDTVNDPNEQMIVIDLDINDSPSTDTGYILARAFKDGNEITELNERVDIRFLTLDLTNRLKVYSPLLKQVVSKEEPRLSLRGEMQGFFEGLMNYRVISTNGSVINEGFINADGDNYVAFVPFSKEIIMDPFSSTIGDTGRLELYELSMEDGSERVLLSIPIRFN